MYEDALKDLNKAIEIAPKHIYAHINRGYIYWKLSDFGSADNDIRTAILLIHYGDRCPTYSYIRYRAEEIRSNGKEIHAEPLYDPTKTKKVYVVVNMNGLRRINEIFHIRMYEDVKKAIEKAEERWIMSKHNPRFALPRFDIYWGTRIYEFWLNTEDPYSALYGQKDLYHKEDLEEWLQELNDTIAHSIAVRPLDYWNRSLIKERFGDKEGAERDMEIYNQLIEIINEDRRKTIDYV
jgi:tetratricopeptide (TPR) repeat protein